MKEGVKILVVEDEMIIAANIALQLKKLGYEVTGIATTGKETLAQIKNSPPDIVLLDIQLKGDLDGIETALLMQQDYNIPIIYLTANADDAYFMRAKKTNPYAFISKPFKKLDLQHAIELTINRIEKNKSDVNVLEKSNVLTDSIFVKHNDNMVKIFIKDILYIEAERNYCRIFSKDKQYLLVSTLKEIIKKLPIKHFLRIHRSFIVNVSQINEVGNNYVVIARKTIPASKKYKSEILERLQTI